MEDKKGIIYLVGTPIGNLDDITYRALKVLQEVDVIAAEDTRHTLKLLNHFELKKTLTSYHEHNKREKGPVLIEKVLEGASIALVSDAGLPGISDPGYDLVLLAQQEGIRVVPIPGANAALTALIASGISTSRFSFEGFLAKDKKERKLLLEKLQAEERTIILYESPHRLKQTLKELESFLGDRKLCLARELTKKHEEFKVTTLKETLTYYEEEDPRGEYVLILEGQIQQAPAEEIDLEALAEQVLLLEKQGLNKKDLIKDLAKEYNIPKRELYNAVIKKPEF